MYSHVRIRSVLLIALLSPLTAPAACLLLLLVGNAYASSATERRPAASAGLRIPRATGAAAFAASPFVNLPSVGPSPLVKQPKKSAASALVSSPAAARPCKQPLLARQLAEGSAWRLLQGAGADRQTAAVLHQQKCKQQHATNGRQRHPHAGRLEVEEEQPQQQQRPQQSGQQQQPRQQHKEQPDQNQGQQQRREGEREPQQQQQRLLQPKQSKRQQQQQCRLQHAFAVLASQKRQHVENAYRQDLLLPTLPRGALDSYCVAELRVLGVDVGTSKLGMALLERQQEASWGCCGFFSQDGNTPSVQQQQHQRFVSPLPSQQKPQFPAAAAHQQRGSQQRPSGLGTRQRLQQPQQPDGSPPALTREQQLQQAPARRQQRAQQQQERPSAVLHSSWQQQPSAASLAMQRQQVQPHQQDARQQQQQDAQPQQQDEQQPQQQDKQPKQQQEEQQKQQGDEQQKQQEDEQQQDAQPQQQDAQPQQRDGRQPQQNAQPQEQDGQRPQEQGGQRPQQDAQRPQEQGERQPPGLPLANARRLSAGPPTPTASYLPAIAAAAATKAAAPPHHTHTTTVATAPAGREASGAVTTAAAEGTPAEGGAWIPETRPVTAAAAVFEAVAAEATTHGGRTGRAKVATATAAESAGHATETAATAEGSAAAAMRRAIAARETAATAEEQAAEPQQPQVPLLDSACAYNVRALPGLYGYGGSLAAALEHVAAAAAAIKPHAIVVGCPANPLLPPEASCFGFRYLLTRDFAIRLAQLLLPRSALQRQQQEEETRHGQRQHHWERPPPNDTVEQQQRQEPQVPVLLFDESYTTRLARQHLKRQQQLLKRQQEQLILRQHHQQQQTHHRNVGEDSSSACVLLHRCMRLEAAGARVALPSASLFFPAVFFDIPQALPSRRDDDNGSSSKRNNYCGRSRDSSGCLTSSDWSPSGFARRRSSCCSDSASSSRGGVGDRPSYRVKPHFLQFYVQQAVIQSLAKIYSWELLL